MKYILLVSTLTFCTIASPTQADPTAVEAKAETFYLSEKLKDLASLTEGITVSQTPDPVLYTTNTHSLSRVQWQHNTTISSISGPVKIIEFGYFVERNGQWELPYGVEVPHTYTANDFAENYDCPNSELQPGVSYANPQTRSIIDCVPEQLVRWYFIGLNAKGDRIKGESDVTLLTELDPSEHGPQH